MTTTTKYIDSTQSYPTCGASPVLCVLALFLHAQTWGFIDVFFSISFIANNKRICNVERIVFFSFVAVALHFIHCIFGRLSLVYQKHNENGRGTMWQDSAQGENRAMRKREKLRMCSVQRQMKTCVEGWNQFIIVSCHRRWRQIIPDLTSNHYQFYIWYALNDETTNKNNNKHSLYLLFRNKRNHILLNV